MPPLSRQIHHVDVVPWEMTSHIGSLHVQTPPEVVLLLGFMRVPNMSKTMASTTSEVGLTLDS